MISLYVLVGLNLLPFGREQKNSHHLVKDIEFNNDNDDEDNNSNNNTNNNNNKN